MKSRLLLLGYSATAVLLFLLLLFEETVSLDVYSLPAGDYTVDVNGVTGSFTLDVDNALQEDRGW